MEWSRKMETLYAAWIEHLFAAPLEDERAGRIRVSHAVCVRLRGLSCARREVIDVGEEAVGRACMHPHPGQAKRRIAAQADSAAQLAIL
mgnify:CR=1 FL=1